VTGYSTEGWGDLFLAAAGATAALSGLIFVGLSVNIRTVLDIDKQVRSNFLTGRAIEALVALLSVLVISLVALTPTIARGVLAAFILLTAATSAISPVRAVLASRSQRQLTVATAWRLVTATSLTLTLLAAGATLAAGHGGGLDWLPASFVLAVAVAAINAWILLVEILR
jgi:modulator of FtsH protease